MVRNSNDKFVQEYLYIEESTLECLEKYKVHEDSQNSENKELRGIIVIDLFNEN